VLGLSLNTRPARSESGGPSAAQAEVSSWLPLEQALRVSKQSGRVLVVVTSSRVNQGCSAFVASLKEVVAAVSTEPAPVFAEMPLEQYEAQLRRIGVATHPTLIVYGAGARKVELVGSRGGFASARQALDWLNSVGVLPAKSATVMELAPLQVNHPAIPLPRRTMPPAEPPRRDRDPDVELTGAHPPILSGGLPSGQAPYPSGQGEAPPMPPPPPKAPPYAPPVYQPPPPPPPSYPPAQVVAPVTGTAAAPVVVSPPQVPVVVQPQAPTIVVGPTPQPNIIFAAPAPSAPTLSYAPIASAPVGNVPQQLFMSAPQPAASAPQPQPMAMAPQPVAMAPQPVAMAPQVGQSPALLAAVLTNPSLINRVLGALGEHLAQRRNPLFQMGQAPQMMQAPVASAPVANAPAPAAMAYAPIGYGGAPLMMGFLAVSAGGAPPAYGYAYGYGPPPGQVCPPPGYGYGPPPGPGYPPYPPQGPPEYPPYPQGPPPIAPSPQGSGQWWAGQSPNVNYPQQPAPNGPAKGGWLSNLWK
jgi:hypothetical protein